MSPVGVAGLGPQPHHSASSAPGGTRIILLAGATGFEPAISGLTGRHVKPLHYAPRWRISYHKRPIPSSPQRRRRRRRHTSPYTNRPPSIVATTCVWAISMGSQAKMSRSSTTRSASFPGANDPSRSSSPAARAAPSV